MEGIKEFFRKTWVVILAWVFLVVGTLILLLGGTDVGNITKIPQLVFAVLQAIGVLVLFIKSLLQAKDTTNK